MLNTCAQRCASCGGVGESKPDAPPGDRGAISDRPSAVPTVRATHSTNPCEKSRPETSSSRLWRERPGDAEYCFLLFNFNTRRFLNTY
jgi:hypothetical protein